MKRLASANASRHQNSSRRDELAIDVTRACATDQRGALLEACAGAHYLVTLDRDNAQERITRLAEIARRSA